MKKLLILLLALQSINISYATNTTANSSTISSDQSSSSIEQDKETFKSKLKELGEVIDKLLEKDLNRDDEYVQLKAQARKIVEDLYSLVGSMVTKLEGSSEEEISKQIGKEILNQKIADELVQLVVSDPSGYRKRNVETYKERFLNNLEYPMDIKEGVNILDFSNEVLEKVEKNNEEKIKQIRAGLVTEASSALDKMLQKLENISSEVDIEDDINKLLKNLNSLEESRLDSEDDRVKQANTIYEALESVNRDISNKTYSSDSEEKIEELLKLNMDNMSEKFNKLKTLYAKYIKEIIKSDIEKLYQDDETRKQKFNQELEDANDNLETMKKIKVKARKLYDTIKKLEETIKKAEEIKKDKIYNNSENNEKEALDNSLEEAKQVLENKEATLEKITTATTSLNNSINSLTGDALHQLNFLYLEIAKEINSTKEYLTEEELAPAISKIDEELIKYKKYLDKVDRTKISDIEFKQFEVIYEGLVSIITAIKNPLASNIDNAFISVDKIDVAMTNNNKGIRERMDYVLLLISGLQGINARKKNESINKLVPIRIELSKLVTKYIESKFGTTDSDEEENLNDKEKEKLHKKLRADAYAKLKELKDKIKEIDSLGVDTKDKDLKESIDSYNVARLLLEASEKEAGYRTTELREAEYLINRMHPLVVKVDKENIEEESDEEIEDTTDKKLFTEAYVTLLDKNNEVLTEVFETLNEELNIEDYDSLNEYQIKYYQDIKDKIEEMDDTDSYLKIEKIKVLKDRIELANGRMKKLRDELAKQDSILNSKEYKNASEEEKQNYIELTEKASDYLENYMKEEVEDTEDSENDEDIEENEDVEENESSEDREEAENEVESEEDEPSDDEEVSGTEARSQSAVISNSIEGALDNITDIDALKAEYFVRALRLSVKQFEVLNLDNYVKKVRDLHEVDTNIISNFDDMFYFNHNFAVNFIRIIEDIRDKKDFNLNNLNPQFNLGFNLEVAKGLKLGSFIEYNKNELHTIAFGINAKYSKYNHRLLGFARYRYVFKDQVKMHSGDILANYGYNIKIKEFEIEPNVSVLASYMTGTKLNDKVAVNDYYKAMIELRTKFRYVNTQYKFNVYLEPQFIAILDSKEIVYQIDNDNNKLELDKKPLDFYINLGLNKQISNFNIGTNIKVNNKKASIGINFSYNK